MQKSVVIASNAGAAWDELGRWASTLLAQQSQAERIRERRPHARVVFDQDDPLLPNAAPDHHSRIRAHAATVIHEHQRLARGNKNPDVIARHMDAVAAWRQVLSERDRTQMEARLRIAITASGAVVDCRRVIR